MLVEYSRRQMNSLRPGRSVDAHKGSVGKVLLLCGSEGFTGAAALAAMGALRTGIGLVYLGVPRCIYQIEAIKLNEAVVFPLRLVWGCSLRDSPLMNRQWRIWRGFFPAVRSLPPG